MVGRSPLSRWRKALGVILGFVAILVGRGQALCFRNFLIGHEWLI